MKGSCEVSEKKDNLVDSGVSDRFVSGARTVERWFVDRGEEVAYVGDRIRVTEDGQVSLVEVSYRKSLVAKDDDLLLVKGYRGSEPLIAFVYCASWIGGIGSLAGLLRAGKLKWKVDEYPSKKLRLFFEELDGKEGGP
jgi:hypothetical protein